MISLFYSLEWIRLNAYFKFPALLGKFENTDGGSHSKKEKTNGI